MYCYTKIYRSPPAQTYLWDRNSIKIKNKKKKTTYLGRHLFLTSIYAVERNSANGRNQNTVLFRNPLRKNQSQLWRIITSSRLPTGFSLSFFRLSTLFHPSFAPPPLLPHIASCEFLFSTNLRNHLHFITSIFYHPWQASPRSLPLCISLPNTAFALLHALPLIANPQQICHSYSNTQTHIMKCNFFRFKEQEDFSKEDDKLDQNICVFLLSRCNSQIPRAISRDGRVTWLSCEATVLPRQSSLLRIKTLKKFIHWKNGLEFESQVVCGKWSFRSYVVEDSGLIASDGVSLR